MSTMSTAGLYVFDPYGTNVSNAIDNELQTLPMTTGSEYQFLIPKASPFFVDSLEVYDNATNRKLDEGIDYFIGHRFIEATEACQQPVAGSVRFANPLQRGVVRFKYQTLGGEWGYSDTVLLAELANRLVNPVTRSWDSLAVSTVRFPVVNHDQPVSTLVGGQAIAEKIYAIAQVLAEQSSGGNSSHVLDLNNPHKVTKDQVDLGNVHNFGLVTDQEIKSSQVPEDRYVPSGVLRRFIDWIVDTIVTVHINDEENPHGVNAAQIGLDKVPNYPTSTSDQAKDPSNTTTLITPATLHSVLATLSTASVESLVSTFQAHVANTENPHQVTAEQIGAITEQQLTEALSGLTMSTFGGKTPQQWESLFIPAATYSELLENLSIAFNGVGTAVGEVDNTSLERVPPINPITGVQAGANGWAYYYADWTTVIVGSTGLPEVLPDGRSTYIDYLDAVYWLDADGYIQSGGTNPRTIPNLTPANNIWSTPSYIYVLLTNGNLVRFSSSSDPQVLITSGVADVFTAGSNENIVFVLKDDGSHVMYGDVLQTGVISNQYNTLKMSPTIGDLVDLQIGYNYVTFLFDSGTVSVNKVNRNGIGVYSLMPEVTPVGNCVQISGQYSHVGIVYESGVWATYGGGLVCQVSPNLGKLASIACGRNFTVTLDTHGNMEFWGYSSDNALQAPRV